MSVFKKEPNLTYYRGPCDVGGDLNLVEKTSLECALNYKYVLYIYYLLSILLFKSI